MVELRSSPGPAALPKPMLLGPYEPLLMGWRSREPVLGGHQEVVTVNGLSRAIALAGGRAVGTWGLADGVVTLRPFGPLDDGARNALADDAQAVATFPGVPGRPMMIQMALVQPAKVGGDAGQGSVKRP